MATNNHASEWGSVDLAREESMLKIQASILERCLRKEVQEQQNAETRCLVLRQKIRQMELEIFKAGKSSAARRCLEDSSRSEFDAVDHGEFLKWLASSSRSASNTPQQEHAELPSVNHLKRHRESADGFHVFSVGLPAGSPPNNTNRVKRARYVSKELPPCLRCRILKKKCDASEPCTHCPTQAYDSEGDFWKVLGCFRGHLRDMADILCPDFSRATSRTLKHAVGGIKTINFVLTKSRISDQKRWRIMHLIHNVVEFKSLSGSSWENPSLRQSLSRSAISLEQHQDDSNSNGIDLQDYESAWAILQLVSMDKIYLTETAYNLFTLISLGNTYSKKDEPHWDIFFQAKRILRQSAELYLFERLCVSIASGTMTGPIPFDKTRATPNTLVLVDLREDVESFLQNFEKLCAGRAKLTGNSQLATFFALLVFSIAKTILTDTYVLRSSYENSSPWSGEITLKISSAYKGLVSVFCWASKSDLVLQNDSEDTVAAATIGEIRSLVNFGSWPSRDSKGTKDFLLSLGTCFLPDGSFNGFLPQKSGIDSTIKNSQSRLASYPSIVFVSHGSDDDTIATRGHGGRRGALSPNALEKSREVRKLGACWNCWAMKVPCSEGPQCERCQKAATGGLSYHLCNRGTFNSIFTNILFPGFLFDQYRTENLQSLMNEYVSEWAMNTIEARVTLGFEDLWVPVSRFTPVSFRKVFLGRDGEALNAWPLPLAFRPNMLEVVEKSYLAMMKSFVRSSTAPTYNSIYQTSELVQVVLEIVQHYYAENMDNTLLRSCLFLYLALYFAFQPVIIPTSNQSDEVLGQMTVSSPVYASGILSHQIKNIFYSLAKSYMEDVLTQLEKLVRSRDRSTWPTCFASMLILFLCIERLQMVSVFQSTFAKASEKDANPEHEPASSCQVMEDIPFRQLPSIFHTVYRTYKDNQKGFNPLSPDFDESYEPSISFDEPSKTMIRELKEKIFDNGKDSLLQRGKSLQTALNSEDFAKANSGRLVARFLLCFVPP